MTGGKVLPSIQVDLIGRNLRNILPSQYLSAQERQRHRLILPSNRTLARKCLFGQSDPAETKKMYQQCVENGRQRILDNFQFDIFTEKFCAATDNNSSNDSTSAVVDAVTVQPIAVDPLCGSLATSCSNNMEDGNDVQDRLLENHSRQHIVNGANDNVENQCNEISDVSNKNVLKRKRSHPYAITGKYTS